MLDLKALFMKPTLWYSVRSFFDLHIASRVIIYIFLSELFVKFIFEFLFGVWYYQLSQPKQYLFFSFMVIDYAISYRRILLVNLRINYLSIFAIGYLFVVVQGIVVGVINGNRYFEIFNDSVPILVFILNILRMQTSPEVNRTIEVDKLLRTCSIILVATCCIGAIASSLGQPATSSAGGLMIGIYIPMLLASLISKRTLSKVDALLFLIVLAFSLEDMNRTTMAFGLLGAAIYIFVSAIKKPFSTTFVILGMEAIVVVAGLSLPTDSKTYSRIVGLTELDFASRKGSVGERGEEARSINRELEFRGPSAIAFGLGHGGLYNVKHTHEYIKDNGHAHYSWALFNLRYGFSGYFYLACLLFLFAYHAFRSWDLKNGASLFASLLCIQSILYMGTYMNFVIFLAGIQLYRNASERSFMSASRLQRS